MCLRENGFPPRSSPLAVVRDFVLNPRQAASSLTWRTQPSLRYRTKMQRTVSASAELMTRVRSLVLYPSGTTPPTTHMPFFFEGGSVSGGRRERYSFPFSSLQHSGGKPDRLLPFKAYFHHSFRCFPLQTRCASNYRAACATPRRSRAAG